MISLSDSAAYCNPKRMIPPHQICLSIIQERLSNPEVTEFRWLDLACGRGQILTHLNQIFSPAERAKIRFFAYDIDQDFVKETQRTADLMGIKSAEPKVGALSDFSRAYPADLRFDHISLINTIHEIHPKRIPDLLYDSVQRLVADGCLYIYDMERISPNELGAVPWSKEEVKLVLETALEELGLKDYEPAVGKIPHSTCDAWQVQINRSYIRVSDEHLQAKRAAVVSVMDEIIRQALRQKFATYVGSLSVLTNYGPDGLKEADDREYSLYMFWALYRALEMKQ